MLNGRLEPDVTRLVFRLLCGMILAAAVAGCAGTPKKSGFPWWPQGSGSTSEDVLSAANVEPSSASSASTLPPAQQPSSADAAAASSSSPSTTGYTEAVRYGDLLFVSGQIADDPASLAIVGSDMQTQVRTAMDNVMRILESHGMTMSNVLSVTLYLQNIDDLPKAEAVYASYFRRSLPARSVVRVNGLPKGSLVEISVIAGK